MKRKLLVSGFFVVVFGLPVCWYLFLQLFGTNRFDLPKMGTWSCTSKEITGASVIVDQLEAEVNPNELARISDHLENQGHAQLVLMDRKACDLTSAIYLVDDSLVVRGTFAMTRSEVDRLLAEIDILSVIDQQ